VEKMKKVTYVFSLIAVSLFIVFLVLLLPMLPARYFTYIERIDMDFIGIFESNTKEDETRGNGSSSKEKTIHLLVIHGIGRHCIGYADGLVTGIAKYADLSLGEEKPHVFGGPEQCGKVDDYYDFEEAQEKKCELIHLPGNSDRDCQIIKINFSVTDPVTGEKKHGEQNPGYIRTQDYKMTGHNQGEVILRLYELTWDPTTRWAKENYVQAADDSFNSSRVALNDAMKRSIINESISDAVLYLGDYQPMMQYPVLMSLCKVISDAVGVESDSDQFFTCDLQKVTQAFDRNPDFFDSNDIVMMTHSLGTRMLFDTLGLIGHEDENFLKRLKYNLGKNGIFIDVPDGSEEQVIAQKVRDILGIATSKIFTLANQVPLLELGTVKIPHVFDVDMDLGEGFQEFIEGRVNKSENYWKKVEPLQLVAFTDPNDLLSYNLKCWYYLRVLRYHDGIKKQKEAGHTKFIDHWFKSCEPDPNATTEHKKEEIKKREAFWKVAEDYVSIADVSVNLKGIRYPRLFAEPSGAHSHYFDDDTIYKLIARGGQKTD
jgi:hypothetical protein